MENKKPNKNIRLGYACIAERLSISNITTSRSATIKTIVNNPQVLIDLTNINLDNLMTILQYNKERGYLFFRMSSNMFPHIGNPLLSTISNKSNNKSSIISNDFKKEGLNLVTYTIKHFKDKLFQIGKYAKDNNMRLTLHIGQFANLASPSVEVLENTFTDLLNHSLIFKYMNLDLNSVNVIHGGGVYGNKVESTKRWISNFKKLPKLVKERLVIENDEHSYGAEDILYICETLNRPMIFDTHHHSIYETIHFQSSKEEIIKKAKTLMPRILSTWTKLGLCPKFHVSEQDLEKRIGAHSYLVEEIPTYLLEIPNKYKVKIDIMIESKGKELSVDYLRQKYNLS
jgi:UV DNA damage endonuclease